MDMNKQEYYKYVSRHVPRSKAARNMLRAFVSGGLICTAGQILRSLYEGAGMESDAAAGAVSVTLVLLGALLTAFGVYDKFAKYGGAGTLVPITGFANAVVSPALEYKTEGKITGTAAKMFVISGPVIVYGVSTGAIYGLILWLTGLR